MFSLQFKWTVWELFFFFKTDVPVTVQAIREQAEEQEHRVQEEATDVVGTPGGDRRALQDAGNTQTKGRESQQAPCKFNDSRVTG